MVVAVVAHMTLPCVRSQSDRHLLNPRVLLVDGEERELVGLARIVRMAAPLSRISTASDGPSALRALEAAAFHLLITEVRIAGMTGAALLTQVAACHPGTIRIVHSSQPETLARGPITGLAHKILTKPATAYEVLAAARWAFACVAPRSQQA
jgi:DNA-binding NarL/FixJ family response regulator